MEIECQIMLPIPDVDAIGRSKCCLLKERLKCCKAARGRTIFNRNQDRHLVILKIQYVTFRIIFKNGKHVKLTFLLIYESIAA